MRRIPRAACVTPAGRVIAQAARPALSARDLRPRLLVRGHGYSVRRGVVLR
ncbi:hypothetical protein ACIPUC_07310 [Streptomyces sp. LARHCF249]